MIFVTVGTHEQQFNRLVEYMDKWAMNHNEEVMIQIGYSSYTPIKANWCKIFPYSKMIECVEKARIIVTHGGPSSFILPLQIGKTPIVVPRRYDFNEHVNNHQVHFCKEVEKRFGSIIVVEEVEKLNDVINDYESLKKERNNLSNNAKFCNDLEEIVENLFNE